jgi:hypothetical protein
MNKMNAICRTPQVMVQKNFCTFTKKIDMTFEKTYNVQQNNQILISLPDRFKTKKKVRVIVEDFDDSREEKIRLLKKASKDPLFLSDISEVTSDFEIADSELL